MSNPAVKLSLEERKAKIEEIRKANMQAMKEDGEVQMMRGPRGMVMRRNIEKMI